MTLPKHARVVIIGGGISGCSMAYHLAKAGWTDIVLLERKQLTSGTTWHAAGLIGQLRGSLNMTRLAKYSADLYVRLEAETGIATGMRQTGSISVALTESRKEEIYRSAALARAVLALLEQAHTRDELLAALAEAVGAPIEHTGAIDELLALLPDWQFTREPDAQTGYDELVIRPEG
jgi:glycine/D-amino acid oxidase-like deaminating enzyme